MKRNVILDTNVLLCLIEFYDSFSYLTQILSLKFEHIQIIIPSVCINETINKLKEKSYSEGQINEELSKLKKLLKYQEVKEEEIDSKEADYLHKKYSKLHRPDDMILAVSKRLNAWRVYTTDNEFLAIIRMEGIDGRKFPTKDKLINYKFKKFY